MPKATLTKDMFEALADLNRSKDGIRGPGNTGLRPHTYKALELRGLLRLKTWRMWELTPLGREAIQKRVATT